ncbi:MAG TPA: NIPSNAP family protein [Candidatus Paceibacterota bacterium]|nr:NIPSNAP family protein [Verrucomicrobiota bacterium]HSA10070.1 NIPSNAP family protein [Candidatus Paceibacterota bacterium]
MKRREFLTASMAVTALAGLNCAHGQGKVSSGGNRGTQQEYYELRMYRLKSGADRGRLDAYLSKTLIPGLNRLGSKPVGVFVQQERTGTPGATEVTDPLAVLVLIPYASIEAYAVSNARLNTLTAYLAAGGEYLESPKDNPAFERIESWLMLAFAGMPRVELPAYCRAHKPRMFELRTYESHSEVKALKKVEMFNSGETQLMRDVGLGPVFFGQALVGSNLPHLAYLLSAEDQEAHKQHWDAFRVHPIWDKLKNDPQYADTVSKISNRFLVPTPYSQI